MDELFKTWLAAINQVWQIPDKTEKRSKLDSVCSDNVLFPKRCQADNALTRNYLLFFHKKLIRNSHL